MAEKVTSSAIVCMVQSNSYHYPMSNVIGATTIALPVAIGLTPLVGGWLWIGTQNMMIFLCIFILAFAISHWVVKHTPGLKRLFITNREMIEEVQEAATTSFFKHGLYRTKENSGILIFISVFEHKVWVLADHGINTKVATGQWNAIVTQITQGIKAGTPAQAICEAVQTVSRILQNHFPIQKDDINELENVIVSD